jgi:hypothetical protein
VRPEERTEIGRGGEGQKVKVRRVSMAVQGLCGTDTGTGHVDLLPFAPRTASRVIGDLLFTCRNTEVADGGVYHLRSYAMLAPACPILLPFASCCGVASIGTQDETAKAERDPRV